jgi:hypothetical protein
MRRFTLRSLGGAFLLALPTVLLAQAPAPATAPVPVPDWSALERPRTYRAQPTQAAITANDLKSRLYQFSDDSMGGRLIASAGNTKGVEYIASEMRRLGLEPAGDNGTFFQAVGVFSRSYDTSSTITVDSRALRVWEDFIPRDQGPGVKAVNGVQVVYGGTWGDTTTLISRDSVAGKFVVFSLSQAGYSQPNAPGTANRGRLTQLYMSAAGIAVAGMDLIPPADRENFKASFPQLRGSGNGPSLPVYLYVTRAAAAQLLGAPLEGARTGQAGRTISGNVRFAEVPPPFPVRNVVARLPGSDPALRNEFVAIGAHNDHVGMGQPVAHDSMYVLNHLFREGGADDPPVRLDSARAAQVNAALADIRRRTNGASARVDSIFNGADDDGSGSMGVLEIAEYFAGLRPSARPKRSLLFVWHVGEEEGMWGSGYFTENPTVPRDSIVAQLNIDMIGRGAAADETGRRLGNGVIHGGTDYVQLIGSRRLSTELGDLAESVNRSQRRPLAFDYALDANGHPQNIYCRSDHWSYAKWGIPIIFFTTGGHADYHQVTDEPQYIDYDKMQRVASFVASLATTVGNLDHRPLVDHPKPDPNGNCQQ